jgi:hypothetical protein
MKKAYILLVISILIFSCGQKKQLQPAKIEIENIEYNIGKIKQGKSAECYFVLKNTGDSTLIFSNIIPECGCTSLQNKNDSIPAGKTDTLKFVIDTHDKPTGEFKSEIRIITNTKPDLHNLKIIAEIE